MNNEELSDKEQDDPRKIFGEDLDSLMNKLDEFCQKHRQIMECTFILKENEEQSAPKIYIQNHVYDTARLVTDTYNFLFDSIMRDLATRR